MVNSLNQLESDDSRRRIRVVSLVRLLPRAPEQMDSVHIPYNSKFPPTLASWYSSEAATYLRMCSFQNSIKALKMMANLAVSRTRGRKCPSTHRRSLGGIAEYQRLFMT
jgi:hypothetical protein